MPEGISIGWQPPPISLGDFELKLDPQIVAEIQRILARQPALKLRTRMIKPDWSCYTLKCLNPMLALPPPGPAPPQQPDLRLNESPPPPKQPLVKRGKGPDEPREGEPADILKAFWEIPEIKNGAMSLLDAMYHPLQQAFLRAPEERVLVLSHSVVLGAGALTGIIANKQSRRGALELLDKVGALPIPGLKGMELEVWYKPEEQLYGGGLQLDLTEYLPFLK